MKLINTIKTIISEAATIEDITDSIKNRKICIIYYDGDEPGGRGLRQIEPVCLGVAEYIVVGAAFIIACLATYFVQLRASMV